MSDRITCHELGILNEVKTHGRVFKSHNGSEINDYFVLTKRELLKAKAKRVSDYWEFRLTDKGLAETEGEKVA